MSSHPKMPHNNRVSASTALKTNDIWSKTIGHDPYANQNEEQDKDNSAIHAESLMLLARISNLSGVESRGGCKRCGMLGHHAYQCRNPIKTEQKEESDSSDDDDEDSESEVNRPIKATPPVEKSKNSKDKKRKRDRSSDEDKSGSESDESADSEHSRKKRKKDKKHKKKKSKKSKKHKKQKH